MIANLSSRERWMVGAGLASVLLVLLWFALFNPYFKAMNRLDRKITAQQRNLVKAGQIQQQVDQLKQQLAASGKQRQKGKPLFSQVEKITEQTGVRDQLLEMRPQPASSQDGYRQQLVDIRLEKLSLGQLVKFLHAVEYRSGGVQVKSLRVKPRFDDRTRLDVNMVLMSLEKL